jgi:hypothetical protein
MPVMPTAMMSLRSAGRRNSRNKQNRDNSKQSHLEDVFHVKSPEPLASGVPLNHNGAPEAARYCDSCRML